MREIVLEIGNCPCLIACQDEGLAELMAQRYRPFLSSRRPVFRVAARATGGWPPSDPSAGFQMETDSGRVQVRGPHFSGWIDLEGRLAQVEHSPRRPALSSFLRIAYSLILVMEGGLLFHACTAVRDGLAYLFSGPTGAGKTTLARLCQSSGSAHVLTDDSSIIGRQDGAWLAFGSPFWGSVVGEQARAQAPIRAIYFLRKASRLEVERLNERQALMHLLANAIFPGQDALCTRRLMEVCAGMARSLPCHLLSFTPDPCFWRHL